MAAASAGHNNYKAYANRPSESLQCTIDRIQKEPKHNRTIHDVMFRSNYNMKLYTADENIQIDLKTELGNVVCIKVKLRQLRVSFEAKRCKFQLKM